MHPISCTNTHHDVTDLANHEMIKNKKLEYLEKGNITFQRNKRILKLGKNSCIFYHHQQFSIISIQGYMNAEPSQYLWLRVNMIQRND